MSYAQAVVLGAIAGLTIFIGLPVARIRRLSRGAQGFLNALATGVLVFLLWDILDHAGQPVKDALSDHGHGGPAFIGAAAVFAAGVVLGLVALTVFNVNLSRRRGRRGAQASDPAPQPRTLALAIATGLGLHNLSEGLAIGQSAAAGSIGFALVLVIGFALHNITEGFGIAAPMASASERPSWAFLGATGLIGGGPTFVGTAVGYAFTSPYVSILFLTLAAGALIYVLSELFSVCRKLTTPNVVAGGVAAGFLVAWATDLYLTYAGA